MTWSYPGSSWQRHSPYIVLLQQLLLLVEANRLVSIRNGIQEGRRRLTKGVGLPTCPPALTHRAALEVVSNGQQSSQSTVAPLKCLSKLYTSSKLTYP
ncbi:hypothetical protein Bpfe_029768 [Biomphalaria pfeifferi]|uniref:Uncharacterized protein n=1 Tax=Biomphalaria pfeifferi TaxID=112525 RepID=A0AAD8EVJ9_BIOPF|nr:hypothetical protein Bpfe_029768 [Biomphalaria pfeifferi]